MSMGLRTCEEPQQRQGGADAFGAEAGGVTKSKVVEASLALLRTLKAMGV